MSSQDPISRDSTGNPSVKGSEVYADPNPAALTSDLGRKVFDCIVPRIAPICLLLLIAAAASLYFFNLSPRQVGRSHDDGLYLVTAKALATGQGYKIISLPQPVSQTKYPILYPFILSLIWRLFPSFPDNLIYMQLFSALSTLVFLMLTYRLFTVFNYASTSMTLGILGMVALGPLTVYFSGMILTEMPYALISIAALYLFEKYVRERRTGWLMGATVLAAVGYLTRSIGISLIIAAFVYLISDRQFRKASLFLAVTSVIIGPWLVWVRFNAQQVPVSVGDTYLTTYSGWLFRQLGDAPVVNILNIFVKNTIFLIADTCILAIPLVQYSPLRERLLNIPTPLLASLSIMIILTVLGLLIRFHVRRRRFSILDLYMLFYLLLILFWPWPPLRFLAVVAPFLLLYLLRFSRLLLDRILLGWFPDKKEKLISMAAVITIGVGLILDLTVDYSMLQEESQTGSSYFQGSVNFGANPGYLQRLYRQVELNTPADAVLASVADPMCYLYTGRKTVSCYRLDSVKTYYVSHASPDRGTSPDEILQTLRNYRVNYLIIFPSGEHYVANHLKALKNRYPQLLSTVYSTPQRDLIILKINLAAINN